MFRSKVARLSFIRRRKDQRQNQHGNVRWFRTILTEFPSLQMLHASKTGRKRKKERKEERIRKKKAK